VKNGNVKTLKFDLNLHPSADIKNTTPSFVVLYKLLLTVNWPDSTHLNQYRP